METKTPTQLIEYVLTRLSALALCALILTGTSVAHADDIPDPPAGGKKGCTVSATNPSSAETVAMLFIAGTLLITRRRQ